MPSVLTHKSSRPKSLTSMPLPAAAGSPTAGDGQRWGTDGAGVQFDSQRPGWWQNRRQGRLQRACSAAAAAASGNSGEAEVELTKVWVVELRWVLEESLGWSVGTGCERMMELGGGALMVGGGGSRAGREAQWGMRARGAARDDFIARFPSRRSQRRRVRGPGRRVEGPARRGPARCARGRDTRRAQTPRRIGAREASGGAAQTRAA
jgi:hypothetical protein